jgi:hypothetical protein
LAIRTSLARTSPSGKCRKGLLPKLSGDFGRGRIVAIQKGVKFPIPDQQVNHIMTVSYAGLAGKGELDRGAAMTIVAAMIAAPNWCRLSSSAASAAKPCR